MSQRIGLLLVLLLLLILFGGFLIDTIGLNLASVQSVKAEYGLAAYPSEVDARLTVWGDCRQSVLIGRAYLLQGQYELALEPLQVGAQCGDDPWAWFYLGQAEYSSGDLEGAARSWQQTPEGFEQAVRLAQAAVQSGDSEAVLAAWQFAAEVDPHKQGPYIQLARLAVTTEPELVEVYLRRAIETEPDAPLAYIELGKYLVQAGEAVEAQLLFEQALALDPSDVSLLVRLAENAAVLGDTSGAISYWQAVALRNERRRGLANYQIGVLAFEDNNYSSALAFFKRAVEIEPENGRFLVGLAGAYVEVGCRQEAIAAYQAVLETAEDASVLEEAQLNLAELAVENDELVPCQD